MIATCVVLLAFIACVNAFTSPRLARQTPRVKPVFENFGLDFAEDAVANTPKELLGEANYKNFVEGYSPNALITGNYNVIDAIRANKLLSLTVDSGLLKALEDGGLTLSQVEKLLPVVDELGLLPFVAKNKELLLTLAPLLIEPAPLLLPLVVPVVKTPPTTFTALGAGLLAVGGYELVADNAFLGVVSVLLAAPALVLGNVLGAVFTGGSTGRTTTTTVSTSSAASKTSAPRVSAPKVTTPKIAPPQAKVATKSKAGASAGAAPRTKRRKMVKVKA